MKILFTGGGTGGHFYPIIAVAEALKKITETEKLVTPKLFFMSVDPYDSNLLLQNNITFIPVQAGKIRRYFSFKNFTDLFKTAAGIIKALWQLYLLYPDVIFAKGGYSSFPAVFAAKILRIPLVIHESDSHPGKVNAWAGKFARRIALSYPEALKYFPNEKSAVTGNPIRDDIRTPISTGSREFLELEPEAPVLLVLGGSQGSAKINDSVIDVLPQLLKEYQIIHQVGKNNFEEIRSRAELVLAEHPNKNRYKVYDYLNSTAMRMAAGVASIIISRAGSTIFEIAAWGVPAIIIPIPESISHDQYKNAFTYARSGAAIVIEEKNLTSSILISEIGRLMANAPLREEMKRSAKVWSQPDAAEKIARELVNIALEHER